MKMSDFLARLEDVLGPRTDGHFEARCPHCGKLGFLDITVQRLLLSGEQYIFPQCRGSCVPKQINEAMGLTFEDLKLEPEESDEGEEQDRTQLRKVRRRYYKIEPYWGRPIMPLQFREDGGYRYVLTVPWALSRFQLEALLHVLAAYPSKQRPAYLEELTFEVAELEE